MTTHYTYQRKFIRLICSLMINTAKFAGAHFAYQHRAMHTLCSLCLQSRYIKQMLASCVFMEALLHSPPARRRRRRSPGSCPSVSSGMRGHVWRACTPTCWAPPTLLPDAGSAVVCCAQLFGAQQVQAQIGLLPQRVGFGVCGHVPEGLHVNTLRNHSAVRLADVDTNSFASFNYNVPELPTCESARPEGAPQPHPYLRVVRSSAQKLRLAFKAALCGVSTASSQDQYPHIFARFSGPKSPQVPLSCTLISSAALDVYRVVWP